MGAATILQAVPPSAATRRARVIPAQSTATPSAGPPAGTTARSASVGSSTTAAAPSSSTAPGAPGEIGGDHRSEERGVGRDPAQLPGHDRHVDAGRERRVVVARPPEVEPAPARAGRGQAGLPVARRRGRRRCAGRGRRPSPRSRSAARPVRVSSGCPLLAGLAPGPHSAIAWPATKRDGSCALPWSKPPLRRMNVVVRRRMRQPSGVRTYSSVYQPRRILWVVCSMNT